MVNAFGYYASAKGMVLVPDLSELSSAAAISSLESAGLDYLLGDDVTTSNSALNNLVAEQDPAAATLVEYGTVVSFSLYNFVSTPPFFPPSFPFFPPFFPTPSVSLDVTSTGQTSVALSWTVSNLTQASIRINRDGVTGSTVNTTSTSTTDGGLTCGTSYSYEIIVYDGLNGTGTSTSATDSVTTDSCALTVSASVSGPAVLISWNQVVGAASYRATTSYSGESPQTLNGISNTSTTFDVVTGVEYTYTVTAYSGTGATGTVLATGSTTFTHPGESTPPFFPPFFPPSFPFFPPFFPPFFSAPTPVGDPVLGPCNADTSGTCPAGGVQDSTQSYSDGSSITTSQCCTYFE